MRGIVAIGLGGAVCLLAATGCRKPSEAKRSDLEEAGFAWTTDDWFRAAKAGRADVVKRFLESGFDAGMRAADGDTALHAAAASGAESVAEVLLDKGLPVDLAGAGDRTPLLAAVAGDQPGMVSWLIRQGADPARKDNDGFSPLMLAVREGHASCIEEIAPSQREHLDDALLLASITGGVAAIDTVTNYGGSVFARMDDGRTPLMLAAENGRLDAVKLLLELGASRFSTAEDGRSAADFARAGGFDEIARVIEEGPAGEVVGLDDPAEIALEMARFVDARAAVASDAGPEAAPGISPPAESGAAADAPGVPASLDGAIVSASVPAGEVHEQGAMARGSQDATNPTAPTASPQAATAPPLVMRHYRETELPLQISPGTDESAASIAVRGTSGGNPVDAAPGTRLPGSRLQVVRVSKHTEDSKLTAGQMVDVAIVEVRDVESGETRALNSSLPAAAHDPLALVEDAATGRRYLATAGQKFRSEDGVEFVVTDVRPSQIVIENLGTGEVSTLPLRGPRG